MNGNNDWRIRVLAVPFSLIAFLILMQIWRIQFGAQSGTLYEIAQFSRVSNVTIYPPRGEIYDRWGILLAGNAEVYELGADLRYVEDPVTIAMTLEQILGLDRDTTMYLLTLADNDPKYRYVVLANQVAPEDITKIDKLSSQLRAQNARNEGNGTGELPSLEGLLWSPRQMRTYPAMTLASNIIGFFSFRDSSDARGFFGIESKYNDLLGGFPVSVRLDQNSYLTTGRLEAPPAVSLVLTIDSIAQKAVENVLNQALEDTGAAGGTIIVMDPRNGEILAMASTPRIDPNQYWEFSDVFPAGTSPFNPAISSLYEPGGMQPFTMAIGLETGAILPDSVFIDTGTFILGGIPLHNWDRGAWGRQDMAGCMRHGLNVCTAWVANQIGPSKFYRYLEAFGFGQETGIDLAGEIASPFSIPGDANWYFVNLGTNSFGQGLSLTPIQIIRAASAFANGGQMVTPHVVRSIRYPDHQYDIPQISSGAPISAGTAAWISETLANAREEQGSYALVPGYRFAGYSGTAEIPGPNGYTSNLTNTTYVGWGPLEDPRFIVLVWLQKPTSSIWGSVVAAPVFNQVASKLVEILGIPDDIAIRWTTEIPEEPSAPHATITPSVQNKK